MILVKKWSKMPVFELIFHTWLLVNQNWVGKRAQSVTRWHARVRGDIGECPKPKKGAFLSIKVVPYSLILVKKWSKMPVSELIFHTWLLLNQNWVRKRAQSVTRWHPRVRGDIGECPKPKKGACLLIKVVPYTSLLVAKYGKWAHKQAFLTIFWQKSTNTGQLLLISMPPNDPFYLLLY